MSWKDYFYFQRGDRVAIVILLALISVTGIFYFISLSVNEDKGDEDTLAATIDSLRTDSLTNTQQPSKSTKSFYYQQKLKKGETIELNTADTTELKKIPGIGSVFAGRIVKYRNSLGGYAHTGQLKEVWGMDEERYAKVKPYVVVNRSVKRLNVNMAGFKELNRHPYLTYQQTKVIADIRQRKGKIESLDRLALLEEFSDDDIKRLSDYLSFD